MKFKDTGYGDLTNKIYIKLDKLNVCNEKLTSLEGSPKKTNGDFVCDCNNLNSLEYCPEIIEGVFNCSDNNLKKFDFFPKKIGFSIYCYKNKLISLKGLPEVVNGVLNSGWNKLINLKDSPQIINGDFYCNDNKLISLQGNLKNVKGVFDIRNNPDLKNVKEQIIKYQIEAENYCTDIGDFSFKSIEQKFNKYKEELKKENDLNLKSKNVKNQDYGLFI